MKKLILITGWAYDAESVNPLAELLSAHVEVQVLTGSEVLKSREIPPVDYIVGWSMGGELAMELLPPTCKKLVLISSTARFCATDDYACGIHEKALRRMILQLKRQPDAVLAEFYKNVNAPCACTAKQARSHSGAGDKSPSSTVEELVPGLEYLLETDLRARVTELNIPVLLLHGREDLIVPSAASEWLNAHLPLSDLQIFPDKGHGLLLHNAADAVDSIKTFLK